MVEEIPVLPVGIPDVGLEYKQIPAWFAHTMDFVEYLQYLFPGLQMFQEVAHEDDVD